MQGFLILKENPFIPIGRFLVDRVLEKAHFFIDG